MVQVLWALDFHRAHYNAVNYTPLLGESWLRRKTGKKDGLITVPVMFTPEGSQYSCSDHHLLTVLKRLSPTNTSRHIAALFDLDKQGRLQSTLTVQVF